jgi:hypothetical protein
MRDLAIALDNRPGALAEMGEALGKAGVSVEGGGAWVVDGKVMYSDHDNQLILVVDDIVKARAVSKAWATESV